MEFRNAIFVVTEERFCPIYNVGDEFNIQRDALTIPGVKPTCLVLVRQIMRIIEGHEQVKKHTVFGTQKVKFECGGCSGLIRFEYKKEREFATTQMKMLAVAKKRRESGELEEFREMLRTFPVFAPLSDNDMYDLFILLRFKKYGLGKLIGKQNGCAQLRRDLWCDGRPDGIRLVRATNRYDSRCLRSHHGRSIKTGIEAAETKAGTTQRQRNHGAPQHRQEPCTVRCCCL